MAIEKRDFSNRAPRYPLQDFHDKIITYSDDVIGTHTSTDFLDISATGLAFVSLKENCPENGSILHLTFTVPGKEAVTIKGLVVRVMPYQRPKWYKRYEDKKDEVPEESFVGVDFLYLSEQRKDELNIYLQHLIESEKLERKQQKIAFAKEEFLKSYKWICLSVVCLIALAISLKIYFG